MNQWQPIETIPDNEKEYLLYGAPNPEEGLNEIYFVGALEDWVDPEDFTHWMELPEPPK